MSLTNYNNYPIITYINHFLNPIIFSEKSQNANKDKLKKLQTKIECIDKIVEEAKSALVERMQTRPEDYKNVLKRLIIQVNIVLKIRVSLNY